LFIFGEMIREFCHSVGISDGVEKSKIDKSLILWSACLDSNQEPQRYERSTLPGSSSKISVSPSRSFTFVRVCSRGFWRITGGIEDRREPPTGLDRTGPRFDRQAAIGVKADPARAGHFGSD
jgi:hypothetical protein